MAKGSLWEERSDPKRADQLLETRNQLAQLAAGLLGVAGTGSGALTRGERYSRIGDYLASEYEEQADAILDFEYWRNGDTSISASQGSSPATATVTQRRPRLFDFGAFAGTARDDSGAKAEISAEGTVEAHYPDYLQ